MRVIFESGMELKLWAPSDFLAGSPGSRGECQFSPTCNAYASCPDLPAEYSEHVGQASDPRYVAICGPRVLGRHGRRAVDALYVLEVLDAHAER
jgi:hypothetical protein